MPHPQILIIGCGNPLFADDGFGPAVISRLKNHSLPSGVKAIDAGTAAVEVIFPFIDPVATRDMIVIDAADFSSSPGTVRTISLATLTDGGIRDTFPGGIAQDLVELSTLIRITLILCQPKRITHPVMFLGLSHQVKRAIPRAVKSAYRLIHQIQQREKTNHHCQNKGFQQEMIGSSEKIHGHYEKPEYNKTVKQ